MAEMGSVFRWLLLGAAFVVTACGASDEADVDTSGTEATTPEVTSGPATDSKPSTSTTASGSEGAADGYQPPPGWDVWRQLPLSDAVLNRDGVSIEVPLIGGRPGEPTNPCARNYELTVHETNTEVRLALFELRPGTPDTGSEEYACTDEGHGWRLTATLEQPLGDRPLVNDTTGLPEAVTNLATILEPTYVPAGWEPQPVNLYDRQLERWYLNPSSANTEIVVSSVPLGRGSNLESQREAFEGDVVRFEDITIRSTTGLKITSLGDGAVTVVWEEGQRLYQVHGFPGVDPTELTAIAESMQ